MTGGTTFDTGKAVNETKAVFAKDIKDAKAVTTELEREIRNASWRSKLRNWFLKKKNNPEQFAGQLAAGAIKHGDKHALH